MQNIYLVITGGVVLAITIPIITSVARHHGVRDFRTQVLVAVLAGLMGAVFITSLRSDVVPDNFETMLSAAVVVAGSLAIAWYAWRAVRNRP